MNYLKKLSIENFQSHENTTLEFDKGLNVIIGPSDQGKTAILRAIKWVLFNEPRGTEFIRTKAAGARVSIEMSNGYVITRERSKGKNRYILTDPEGEESVYEGFGNEIPYEILKAHGIRKEGLDPDVNIRLNFAEQLEGPFLISQSGAVRAKVLGRLTGTHILDRAIKDCMTDIRRSGQTLGRLREELDLANHEIEQYKDLELLGLQIEEASELIKEIENLQDRAAKLGGIYEQLSSLSIEESKIREILDSSRYLEGYERLVDCCRQKIQQLQILDKYQGDLKSVETGIEETGRILENTGKTKLAGEALDQFGHMLIKLDKLTILKDRYTKISRTLHEEAAFIEKLREEGKILTENYVEALKKSGRCPLCDTVISEEKVFNILNDINHGNEFTIKN